MTEVYLKSSQTYENVGGRSLERSERDRYLSQPTQKYCVLCNAVDGAIYRAHVIDTEKNNGFAWPDAIIEGPFDKTKLIYFEYTTGPAGDIEFQIRRKGLSQEEAGRVWQAYGKQRGSRRGVGVHHIAQKLENA